MLGTLESAGETLLHTGLDVAAVPPYTVYYGSYELARGINSLGKEFGLPGEMASHFAALPLSQLEALGLSGDALIDWIKGHTVNNESICDEGVVGYINPLHSYLPEPLKGPEVYLPGIHEMVKSTLNGDHARAAGLRVLPKLAATALMGATLSGCASVDPTDPSHFTNVLVRNDTTSAVQFIQCDTSCGTLHERRTIPAGGSTVVNVSNEGIKVGYVVARPERRKLGCVYMKYEHVKYEPTVLVSSMTRCE